jgi:hypothetical protein
MTVDPSDDRAAVLFEPTRNAEDDALWRAVITGEHPAWRRGWRFRRLLPARVRCKNCNAPFTGVGGLVMRLTGRGQYNRNPRFCDY